MLLGSYHLEDGSELILKPCDNNVCYSFAGRPGQSKVFKAQNNFWFTPNLNRAFKVVKTTNSKNFQVLIKDFIGERVATRKL